MKSELSSATVLACSDLVLSYYPMPLNSSVSSKILMGIMRFLNRQMQYSQLSALSKSLTGTTEPIDKLQTVMTISPDPLPTPDELDIKDKKKSRAWTQYEDQRLLAGIFTLGIDNWSQIAKFVGNGRTRSQCSQRWFRGLDPKISKDHWAPTDDQRLMQLVQQFGVKSWTAIAQQMGNRSDVQCRYRYQQILRRNRNIGELQAQRTQQKAKVHINQMPPPVAVQCQTEQTPETSLFNDDFQLSFDTDNIFEDF